MVFTGAHEIIGIWIAGFLSLAIYTFLYKDNPVYKVAEHLFLGVALGWGISLYYWEILFANGISPLFYPPAGAERNYLVIFPMVLGVFVLLRLVPRLSWLSRYAFAVYIGGGVGIAVPTVLAGNFLPQLADTMRSLVVPGAAPLAVTWGVVNGLLIMVGVFATLLYFFYSLEHRGAVGSVSRVGVFFIMIAFGAGFGNTVMARISLLIGRFIFLIDDWWGRAIAPLFGGG